MALKLLAMASADDDGSTDEGQQSASNTEADASDYANSLGGWSVVQWLHSLDLHTQVAQSLTTPAGVDSFKYVTEILTQGELSRKLASGGVGGL